MFYILLALGCYAKNIEEGLLPAAQYINPDPVVKWNTHKGGTDVMSRVLSNGEVLQEP